MSKPIWISEKEAAERLGRKPETIRKLVKSGKWQINFSAINNRRYHYDLKGIEKLMLQNSSVL